MILLYRIDDRLLHGQVVEGWLPETGANCVVIVNDELAKDNERQKVVTLAVQEDTRVHFFSLRDAVDGLGRIAVDADARALVIFAGPRDLLGLLDRGLKAPQVVNVGGLHYAVGKLSLGRFMTLSDEDKEALSGLLKHGVHLDARSTPWDEPVDIVSQLTETTP